MTTAQELAMAFAYSTWHTATAKGRVHKLIACIDARFAELREKEDQCSNTSSAVSSPRVSFSSATTSTEVERTAVDTKPDAPTESSTPSPKSGASSLDERAEALFAANPEWRPGDDWKLTFDGESWQWVEYYSGCPVAEYPLKSVVQPFLLSALLPRAIERWWSRTLLQQGQCFIDSRKGAPPSDLESAIRVLEGK